MSIPMKAACGAATVTLALTTGPVALADDAPPTVRRAIAASTAEQSTARTQSRAVLRARRLALLQRAVRKKRAAMTAKWDTRARRAVAYALKQRGRPYVWGGNGGTGFDCSGLVQQAWRRAGVSIPRVTHAQYRRLRWHVQTRGLRAGDLVFFHRLGHVGMYLGNGRFVHAPHTGATVTVARLTGYYKRTYVGAVRPAWVALPKIPAALAG